MKKLLIVVFTVIAALNYLSAQSLKVRLAFNESVSDKPVTGRVIIFFNKNTAASFNSPRISNPMPSFAVDVKDWKPGEFITITNDNAVSWMGNLDSLSGWYSVQGVLKTNMMERFLGASGNGYTDKNVVYIEEGENKCPVNLLFNVTSPGRRKFRETELIKKIKIESKLISTFYNSQEFISGAVILPQNYFADTTKYYSTVYVFPAWNTTHYDVIDGDYQLKRYGMGTFGTGQEKIFVFVDHDCRNGYHEFCNSENNGPRELTFFDELIPYIERNFRVKNESNTRFLMGHSSGAWAGLWLLINNPEKFGGAFVSSPDPVDFTSFLGSNIYDCNTNFFYKTIGSEKFLTKSISIKDWIGLDKLLGSGEQMYSFDAVFSNRATDGKPEHLFDWETGELNPEVAKSWANYDLSKVVSKMNKQQRELLSDKIHIYVAEDDDIGLNIPVKFFKKVLDDLGIGSEIVFFEKGGHTNFWTEELRNSIHEKIDTIVKEKD